MLLLIYAAVMEWLRELVGIKPTPWMYTGMAAAAAVIAVIRLVPVARRTRNIKQGAKGERAVGEFLERLRERGYRVFHDVVSDDFNVDHVLVGPAGVLTIETKTISKPSRESTVQFDGKALRVAGREMDRDPVTQARAQASWIAALLQQSLDQQWQVRPVVLFPGWYVESAPGAHRDVWVLEPKALPSFLENEPTRLSADSIALAAKAVSMHVRGMERMRKEGRGRSALRS